MWQSTYLIEIYCNSDHVGVQHLRYDFCLFRSYSMNYVSFPSSGESHCVPSCRLATQSTTHQPAFAKKVAINHCLIIYRLVWAQSAPSGTLYFFQGVRHPINLKHNFVSVCRVRGPLFWFVLLYTKSHFLFQNS